MVIAEPFDAGRPRQLGLRDARFPQPQVVEPEVGRQVGLVVAGKPRTNVVTGRPKGLPIPQDLRGDFEPRALDESQDPSIMPTAPLRIPILGMDPIASQPTLAPTMQDLQTMPADGGVAQPGGVPEPVDADQSEGGEQRPDESDEARGDMPKQSAYADRPTLDDPTGLFQNHERIKALANAHRPKVKVEPKPVVEKDVEDALPEPEAIQRKQAVGLYQGPRHIGMRRHIGEDTINEELQA